MTEEQLVGTTEDATDSSDTCFAFRQVVAFHLDGKRYGLPIDRVQEIQQIVEFSDVPNGGTGVVGLVNLRGNVIPAVDLRERIGIERLNYTLETPMIICRTDDGLVALLVDEVEDVVDLPEGCVQAAPSMHALSSRMIGVARMGDGLLYVLDLDLLLQGVEAEW